MSKSQPPRIVPAGGIDEPCALCLICIMQVTKWGIEARELARVGIQIATGNAHRATHFYYPDNGSGNAVPACDRHVALIRGVDGETISDPDELDAALDKALGVAAESPQGEG